MGQLWCHGRLYAAARPRAGVAKHDRLRHGSAAGSGRAAVRTSQNSRQNLASAAALVFPNLIPTHSSTLSSRICLGPSQEEVGSTVYIEDGVGAVSREIQRKKYVPPVPVLALYSLCSFSSSSLPKDTVATLQKMGHKVEVLTGYARSRFGRGQIIRSMTRPASDGSARRVYIAGSDPRADGCAAAY